MLFLVAALAAPAIGPALYGGLHAHPKAVRLVDGFVYLAVPLLVAWQVVPFAREDRGLVVPLLVLAGLVLPNLFERASRAFEAHTDNFAIIVGLSGLALHALLEGAALGSGGTVALAFGLAIVLHRIPVSLVIWWLIRPRPGPWAGVAGVAAMRPARVSHWPYVRAAMRCCGSQPPRLSVTNFTPDSTRRVASRQLCEKLCSSNKPLIAGLSWVRSNASRALVLRII